jgi:cytochrome b involved in lipid metabolism
MKRYLKVLLIILSLLFGLHTALATNFTLTELSSHNTAQDCYLAIEGKVYDITPYFGSHPGGDPYLLSACGKDATAEFATKGGNGVDHSARAYSMLDQYYSGDLASSNYETSQPAAKTIGDSSSLRMLSTYSLVIPIFIAWILLLIIFNILGKKTPLKIHKGIYLRITAVTMLMAFLAVAGGGVYMTLFGRLILNGFDTIILHVYSGFIFVLAALTHIYLHRKEIWLYIKKIFGR